MTLKQVDFNDETGKVSESIMEVMSGVIKTAMTMENVVENAEVSVTFVDDERIQSINKEFRGLDKPTDVLSFALNEGENDIPDIPLDDETIPELLGDIIISVPRAEAQAKEYGHSFEREINFLLVHGFLHLLGYDHGSEEEEKKMFARQEEILEEHGLKK
ncbi:MULTISPECIES: rRNA maturation RNase YbeY [Bacillaceae]|uniref:Endoribonuclease YbeY n=1 Tax=Evansella alkalicola TaxID=745819 RepID=A0ABS6JV86_9BACI|nr:rRNA maturation RNase YbeY [Litchfieldia alkalitelluris]MBU9722498.1 rRNA maturation RNase YbeY [Bacillus alkalicola]